MLRRVWKPITASLAIGAPAYLYYISRKPTFDLAVSVKGPDGKRETQMKKLPLLSVKDVESRLSEHAISNTESRPGGLVWKHTTTFLPSNNPIEDANSHQIIQKDDATGDYLFFAVMDGHSGTDTSKLLSKTIIKATALQIAALAIPQKPGLIQSLWGSSKPRADSDPKQVALAIQRAFENLDEEIVKGPVRIVTEAMEAMDKQSREQNQIPDVSQHPLALPSILPALSGSCAIMAVFDTAHRDLYVACTGDSRAVAGVWEPTSDGNGKWRVDVLSEDQTGRNPKELARMQSEHPKEEADSVIRNGRVLGGLEPTRAFGDARYKWPREIQAILHQAIMVGNGRAMREPPPTLKTPPYVTATPVVSHRKLSFNSSAPEGALRFVVLATDGLWDELTSEEVVSLVGGHFQGLKGSVPKSELPNLVPTSTEYSTVQGKSSRRQTTDKSWAFVDDNISTHLIRNALGGADEMSLRKLLSIPAPLSRRYRDDITVTVVWWEQGHEESARVASFTEKSPKSKL